MATAGYELFFYDTTATRRLLLTGWEYFEFHQRVSSPWNHVLRIELGKDSPTLTFIRDNFERDWILEAYRTDEITGEKSRVYEGFNRTIVDQVTNEGIILLTMYGVGYSDLILRRIVVPEVGEEYSAKSGPAETIMKEFVLEQAITPVDSDRILPGLANETNVGRGETAEYSARYTNLMTVIQRCAEQGQVDFGVVGGDTTGEFFFSVRDLWGTDRRVGNADGNPPTIFDLFLNNMEIPIFSKSGGDEKNTVYVGGEGIAANRTILEMELTDDTAVSPWNRREAFVDARNQPTIDGLTTSGQAYLNENRYIEKFTFNLRQTLGTRWIRDWELGDLITARYFDEEFEKKIVEVSVTISAGETGNSQEEVISAELENIING